MNVHHTFRCQAPQGALFRSAEAALPASGKTPRPSSKPHEMSERVHTAASMMSPSERVGKDACEHAAQVRSLSTPKTRASGNPRKIAGPASRGRTVQRLSDMARLFKHSALRAGDSYAVVLRRCIPTPSHIPSTSPHCCNIPPLPTISTANVNSGQTLESPQTQQFVMWKTAGICTLWQ